MTGSRAARPGRRRHRAAQPRLRHLLLILRPTPRGALGAAAALTAGVLVAAGLAAGSYAFLNSQATAASATTIKSGNLALTVQYGAGAAGSTATIPTTSWATMLPGDVVGQQFTLASTGTAGSTYTARLSATSAWEIRVAPGTCPATQIPGAALTTTAVSEGSILGGANTQVCVQATLPTTAAAAVSGTTAGFTVILDSTQVPS